MENWYLIALLASFVAALYVYVNQFLKLDANVAMVYGGVLKTIIMIPFIFMFEPIQNPYFYLFCAVQGILIYSIDSRVFRLSRDKGAEVTSIYQPLTITAIFLLWFVVSPSKLSEIMNNKLVFCLEILCLVLISFAIIKIKNAKASKDAIPFIIPMVLLGIAIDTMNKMSMQMSEGDLMSAVYYYNLITAVIVGTCGTFNYKKQKISYNFLSKKGLISGAIIVFVVFSLTVIKNVAMYYTPNPAYVSAIMGIVPLWVVAINFILLRVGAIQSAKTIDLKWTILLVAGVSAMILLANGAIL